MAKENIPKKSILDIFLNLVEKGGNALPHPATLFASFAFGILVLSWIGGMMNWSGVHPGTGDTIYALNLLSKEGLHKIMLKMVENYVTFAPLGIVMVAMLGIGIAESSGLISSAIRLLVQVAPKSTLTFVIVLAGVISNMASDLGYVLIIPLGAVIYHSIGKHPIAGMAAAFAGVSGGFSANLFIGTIDPLLAGLSTEAAKIIDPDYYVLPTANYYFMLTSTFLIAFSGTFVTNKFIEPRLGKYTGDVPPEPLDKLNPIEKRGLRNVSIVFFIIITIVLIGLVPESGFLRGAGGSVLHSPVLKGFIAFLFVTASLLGITYGFTTGKFKTERDVVQGMIVNFKTLASFLVLVFFAAQFVAYFKWSNLGLLIAINGADILKTLDIGLIPLIILFIIITGVINLFMGSASAKWAILGPVFIPMFMLLGYSPELTQAIYRVGDSVTNIISPMMSFFALIIVYFEKYDKNAGLGTLISTMLPYSIVFFVLWTLLMILWTIIGLPLGPGSPLYYP